MSLASASTAAWSAALSPLENGLARGSKRRRSKRRAALGRRRARRRAGVLEVREARARFLRHDVSAIVVPARRRLTYTSIAV